MNTTAPAKKAPAKKAAPAKSDKDATKEAPASTPTPAEAKADPKPEPKKESTGKPVKASTDPNHQQWQVLKRDLTAAMGDLLYDSRRVKPGYSKDQAEATAKVTSALKVLTEFTESIRLKD